MPGGTTRSTIQRIPIPIYVAAGSGAWLTDVDGNRYLDLNNNYTTLIHGHAFEPVVRAVERQLRSGTCFANPTEHEIALSEILCSRVPSIEKVRYVNTGTEAVMFAVKAARAITGRTKVAKLEGAYHGAYDWIEISESSSPENWGEQEPASVAFAQGTPTTVLDEVVVLPPNDLKTTEILLERHAAELACVVIDLVPSRAGLIPLDTDYVDGIRAITKRHGIVLICDEVLNFRQSYNGASARFGLEPDLITLGKIIGGGLPIGAVAGLSELMAVFDNSGGRAALPQGGTFAANPLSMVAGIASMEALDPSAFHRLEGLGERVRTELASAFGKRGLPMTVTGLGSLFRVHFKARPPRTYREFWPSSLEVELLQRMSRALLAKGVILPPMSCSSLSTAMTDGDIGFFLATFGELLDEDQELHRMMRQMQRVS
jgi:glutamate-1-semialdehyde 2,1-aminomutase